MIRARDEAPEGASYTKSLLTAGAPRIAKKFGEEAIETVIAALGEDKEALASEIADVLYHLLGADGRRAGLRSQACLRNWSAAPRNRALRKKPRGAPPPPPWRPSSRRRPAGKRGSPPPITISHAPNGASFAPSTPLTLTHEDLKRLKSLHEPISLEEVIEIYPPLSRLLALYVAATQGLFKATQRFLGAEDGKVPYIIGVAV